MSAFLRHRNDEDEGFECPTPITCQFPRCNCPSSGTPCEGSAAPATQSPVPAGAALIPPGTRVRMSYGWPLLEQYCDGVLQGYRPTGEALVQFDGDDFNTIVSPGRLSLAPPRNDGFGDDE
jgi:hypothetical protein